MKKVSSKLFLLDVNVLLAIAWPNHQFHLAAVERIENTTDRWATCALTQLAFIRLSSNPAAIPEATSPADAAALLGAMVADPQHVYLASLPSPVEKEFHGIFEKILGNKQVMDIYLLGLARRHRATFLTFDAKLQGLCDPDAFELVSG
jgi:uncharacterized protein